MLLFKKLLAGVGAEFRAIFGVVLLLRTPFWIAWGLCFLPAFVGLLPGDWPVFAQIVVLVGYGLAGLFSGTLAKRVRRWKWVEYPDGPEAAPYLPQLITVLAGPPYLLAMVVLFQQTAATFPGVLPTADLPDALLLSLDNFIRTQIFFDAAECFHLRTGGEVEGWAGKSLVFLSRFLMDLVFIKLAVQILNAAYFRAQGLGRGQDILFTLKQEIEAQDVPRVKDLCQQVGDSLRDAVDTLRRHYEPEALATGPDPGDKSAMAWRCLVTMKDYAIPYLKTRHRAATGDERERIAKFIDRLDSAPAEEENPPPTRPWLLIALAAGLVLGVAVSFVLSGTAALVVAGVMTALTSWMLAGSRGWIDRLVRWRALLPSTPDRLARLQLRWVLCVLPPLLAAWARLFELVAQPLPDIFGGADGTMTYPSALAFVLESLLHLQIVADAVEIYGVQISKLRQEGFIGGLLTLLLRLVLNVGIIALLVSFGMVWFNRVFRKFAVSPNAELALRQEVSECGPQAAVLIGYHLREVRGFLMEQMKRQEDRAMLVALAASGFFKDVQSAQSADQRHDSAEERISLGNDLQTQGRLEEAVAEYQAAREIYERLVPGRPDLRTNLAITRANLGVAVQKQGRLKEAVEEYQAAREIYERLVYEGRRDLRKRLAATRINLGAALDNQNRLEEAVAEYQAAREIYERLVGEGCDGLDDVLNRLAATRMNLGSTFRKQGRQEEAVKEYQAAREIRERLVREGRDDLLNRLAATRTNLGNGLRSQSRLAEAVSELLGAREIYERLVVREGQDGLSNEWAKTRLSLGKALSDQGRLEDAVAEYQAAREIRERLVREGQLQVVTDLAMCWFNALEAATKISEQEAISVNRSAFSFLHELLPQRSKLAPAAFMEIGKFLRCAQESKSCADEAATLALQFAPS